MRADLASQAEQETAGASPGPRIWTVEDVEAETRSWRGPRHPSWTSSGKIVRTGNLEMKSTLNDQTVIAEPCSTFSQHVMSSSYVR